MSTTHFEMHGKSDGLMEGGRAGRRGGLPRRLARMNAGPAQLSAAGAFQTH